VTGVSEGGQQRGGLKYDEYMKKRRTGRPVKEAELTAFFAF
jgi:hypothetical protein